MIQLREHPTNVEVFGYTSDEGYTMKRECAAPQEFNGIFSCVPWVLRAPNGDYVDSNYSRADLAEANGFRIY